MLTLSRIAPGEIDRFDIAHALHHFCMEYHTGQGSRLDILECKLATIWGFKDSPLCHGLKPGYDDVAIMIYEHLVENHA